MTLRNTGLATMAYFYFDFRDANKRNRRDLLLSLLSQLSARSDLCCNILHRLYITHDRGALKPTDDVLMQSLKETLTYFNDHPIYIIMDAIDECPNTFGMPSPRELVLDLVTELVELSLPNLHICVTSRPEIDIRSVLEPLTSLRVSLHDETGQKEDIVEYVISAVHTDTRMGKWQEKDHNLVIEALSERADGMCVRLIAKDIGSSLTSSEVPMGFLPTGNSTTLSAAKSATHPSGASRISRRNIRAHIEKHQPGDPPLRTSSVAMSHSRSSTSPPRGACGSTCV